MLDAFLRFLEWLVMLVYTLCAFAGAIVLYDVIRAEIKRWKDDARG